MDIGWKPGEAFAQHVCAMVTTARGRYDEAFPLIHRSLALSRDIGHRQWSIAGMSTIGGLFLDLLDAQHARFYLDWAMRDARAMGSRLWVLNTSAVLAAACLLAGDLDAGQAILDDARLPDVAQSCLGARNCWLVFADVCRQRGDAAQALRIIDGLFAAGPHLTEERAAPRLAHLRGEALAQLGRLEEAEAVLHAAVEGADALERPGHGWRARIALGQVLRARRRQREADAAFAEARATIEVLAATVPDEEVRKTFLTGATAMLPAPREPTARQAAARACGGLTEREREIAGLVARGLSNRVIAERLSVSEPTVATHVSHILAKLGFSSRTQVATWVIEAGLLHESSGQAPKDHQT
jgi:DNA-binding CsgD family transcriptional regulator